MKHNLLILLVLLMVSTQWTVAQNPFFQVYGPTDVNGCSAEAQHYSIETSAQLVSTHWSLIPANGIITSDIYFADIIFTSPGTYTLVVSSMTIDQMFLSDTLFIYASGSSARPEVLGCYEFESDSLGGKCYQVCAFSQSTLLFQGGASEWFVTGAESYTEFNDGIEITWGAGGIGTVLMLYQGCETELCFKILPEPVADFNTDPPAVNDTITVCKLQEIFFENNSYNGIHYLWMFGDGQQSTGFDATHVYAQEGYYTVTLTANSICDCADDKQIVVEVLPSPAPMLDCVNSVCPETRQRYTVTPSGCSNYSWSVSSNGTIVNGGESTDEFIEVIWHEGPDGYIYLSVSGCAMTYCTFTNTFRVPIISPDGPVEGDASVCAGEISTYTAPYFPGTEYTWSVGAHGTILGGQNTNGVTIQWDHVNSVSNSIVEVNYNNCFLECSGQDQLSVTITPEIFLTGDIQVCADGMATISAEAGFGSPSPANVMWHIEDEHGVILYTQPGLSSTFSHVFSYSPGVYTCVATNMSPAYCTEIVRHFISVTAIPDMPLGIKGEDRICPGQMYGYTVEASGNFTTEWTITDGASTYNYSGQSCHHTFGPTPPYVVTAYHTDIQYNACQSDPVTITLQGVDGLMITGPTQACFNGIDSFMTEYISGADYAWEVIPADHGEIRTSNLNEVQVFWSQPGSATLRLTICGTIINHSVFVNPPPAFNILGPLSACANEMVSLTTDQPTLAHQWFDENENVIGISNTISLPPGSFAAEVKDPLGCANTKTITIGTWPAPEVHLSTPFEPIYCVNIPGGVAITANTDGSGYTYEWFIDNVSQGVGGPIFNVTSFGQHHVEVTNQYGCSATSLPVAFINCCDPASCGLSIPGLPGGCTLGVADLQLAKTEMECQERIYTSTHPDLIPGSATWYVYSNSEGYLEILNSDVFPYTYSSPGYYHVFLEAQLSGYTYDMAFCGHIGKMIDTVRAVADFKSDGVCAAVPVVFEDLTTFLPGETIASWSWDFGDPASGASNSSAAQDPSHTYANGGTYEITLSVTMASGCVTTKKHFIDISAGPSLNAIYAPIYCEDEAMAFELLTEVYDIYWTFGDPGSGVENGAFEDSVFHTFSLPGFYNISVSGKDIYGCPGQSNFTVDITANTLSGFIDVMPATPLCAGDTATLTAPAGSYTYLWSTDETTQAIQVAESNQFDVLITDQYYCTYSPPPVFIVINPTPVVTIQAREIYGPDNYGPWSSSLQLCYGEEFELQAFSTGNVSYSWNDGSNTQILQFINEAANLPGSGTHEYTVITTELSSMCVSDTASIIVEIYDLPVTPMINLVSGSACSFNPNVLQVMNPQPGVTYVWSDGQEGISMTTEQAGVYQVTAVNEEGCTALSNSILIRPSSLVDQIPGGCYVECDPLDVCLPALNDVASYTIYHNGNEIASGNSWPGNYSITEDGSYTIEVTSYNGCVATSDPLDVMLYTGVGSITVETWFDQDGDMMISAGDILLPGIPVEVQSGDGLHFGKTETVPDGWFVFEDYPATSYMAIVDRQLLSSQYRILIDSVQTQIQTCDDSVVVQLLLTMNCMVSGPDFNVEMCNGDSLALGDSTWTMAGNYTMHMSSAGGCDSIFQVNITAPDSLEINAYVWVDVDHNGVVSPADTVISGIIVFFDRMISQSPFADTTDINGLASGWLPVADYWIYVDSMNLPPGFTVVDGEEFILDTVCGSIDIHFLLENSCLSVFVILQDSLCPGDSLYMDGQWISQPGQYTFVHTDSVTMCDTVIDLTVSLYPELNVTAATGWNCIDMGTITLEIQGIAPYSISWSHGPTDSVLYHLIPGDYTVIITDDNGCEAMETYSIEGSSPLSFSLPSNYFVLEGDSVIISIEGDIDTPGLTFTWDPSTILSCDTCPVTWAHPVSSTDLFVLITDADSCTYALETTLIIVQDTSDQLYAPNVFSPNQDGINDHWRLFTKSENAFVYELLIFDRWGTNILAKSNYDLDSFIGWDGTFNGKPYNPGVYTYIARLRLGDGRDVRTKGDITLLR